MSLELSFHLGANFKVQEALHLIANEVLPLLYQNRRIVRLLYNSAIDPYWEPFLEQQYTKWASKIIVVSPHNQFEIPAPFSRALVVKHVLDLISTWITSPFPEEPALFQPKFIKITSKIIPELTL